MFVSIAIIDIKNCIFTIFNCILEVFYGNQNVFGVVSDISTHRQDRLSFGKTALVEVTLIIVTPVLFISRIT